ncbi:Membrane protein CcdC involved in cytochrome C biogenesis [Granulicella rosea]|uniref:Membrane protein CcdC involved in cytochrome C biogenesis n=1 Tax=Granulicella rosea TaxID=474952 RepID=A0A239D2T3_9BACT|nr:cytochrome c biogenesis protein CcdC [Granulicella rosea]SNS26338.1 Membrane protein CcdC involved in cytochrome C biogenesis [Granulicella rosea]
MHLRPWMSVVSAILGFFVILMWRIREGRSAVTERKILIPPLGMSTGFCMFFAPMFRVPLLWAAAAFLIGALLLAWPLVRTSRLALVGNQVMMHRSPMFFAVMVVLAIVRILAHSYLDTVMSIQQTAGLFFILAFGMILRWRVSMYFEYRRVTGA